jgi:hypothetical protein
LVDFTSVDFVGMAELNHVLGIVATKVMKSGTTVGHGNVPPFFAETHASETCRRDVERQVVGISDGRRQGRDLRS